MTARSIDSVLYDIENLHSALSEIGFEGDFNPFLALAFLSLPVIPKLKLTDMGLFDVDKFEFVSIEVWHSDFILSILLTFTFFEYTIIIINLIEGN